MEFHPRVATMLVVAAQLFSETGPSWGQAIALVSQNSNAAASIWIVDPESATPFQKLVELPAAIVQVS